jgi:lipid A oxidase
MRSELALLASLLCCLLPAPTAAEDLLSVYGGVQGALSSHVSGQDTDRTKLSFDADWEGQSLDLPPYYGLRYTRWLPNNWGWAIDFTHAKIFADEETLARSGFERLSLSHGLNTLTVGVLRRFPTSGPMTPYLGAGLGISSPHVEAFSPAAAEGTSEYQFGGPVAEVRAGLDWRLSERWSIFAEYEGTYADLDADLKGGGSLHSEIRTNAINLGVSFTLD